MATQTVERTPLLAEWETTAVQPVGSTKIGSDDTGTWNQSSEDNDT